MSADTLPLGNTFEFCYAATKRDPDTGARVPAAGLVGMKAWISQDERGATIHADLEKNLGPRAQVASEYFALVGGDALRTHLQAYVGQVVYEVYGDGVQVLYSFPRVVTDIKQA